MYFFNGRVESGHAQSKLQLKVTDYYYYITLFHNAAYT